MKNVDQTYSAVCVYILIIIMLKCERIKCAYNLKRFLHYWNSNLYYIDVLFVHYDKRKRFYFAALCICDTTATDVIATSKCDINIKNNHLKQTLNNLHQVCATLSCSVSLAPTPFLFLRLSGIQTLQWETAKTQAQEKKIGAILP